MPSAVIKRLFGSHPVPSVVSAHALVFGACLLLVVVCHWPYLSLPYYWDELGQFIPASVDLLEHGQWVPMSTVPNVHPPGVMLWLALVWRLAGRSVPATRIAMLVIAAAGLYVTFLLAVRMGRQSPGAPAFAAALLMLTTPLFYTQAMMAQLDMLAMAFTALALWLFLERRYAACVIGCVALVMTKETGVLLPVILASWLIVQEKRSRQAVWFGLPALALAAWLLFLKRATGNWFGDAAFAHYNVDYALDPVRVLFAIARRTWYLFLSDFRWIGALSILYGLLRSRLFHRPEWALLAVFFVSHVVLVSLLGGATLERYLLPVLPVLYIAVATGWSVMERKWRQLSLAGLAAGMLAGFFWNPPFLFPFENNLAMVDFVELQQTAVDYLRHAAPGSKVATAWPYTDALHNPEASYVRQPFRVVETSDFRLDKVVPAVEAGKPDLLVVYSRNWEPQWSLARWSVVDGFLRAYYDYQPQITAKEIEEQLGMHSRLRLSQRGQWVEIYSR